MRNWWRRNVLVGLGLGLPLAVVGELWTRERLGMAQALPNPALVMSSGASGFAATGALLGVGTVAIHGRHPRLARLICAVGLWALGVYHAGALLVLRQAGEYPSLSALRMLLGSPVQLVGHALEGYRGSVFGLLLGALAGGIAIEYALRRPLAAERPGRRFAQAAVWVATPLAVHLGCLGLGLSLHGASYLRATPESSLLASLWLAPADAEAEAEVGGGRGQAEGAAIDSARAFWERVDGHAGPRPNVVLVVLESVPASGLGSGGYERPVSPRLDAIARDSLQATRVWATATQSNYAQMAILSSLHPRRGEHLDTYDALPYPRVLPHDVFHRLGYATATVSSQNESWLGMRAFETTDTPNPILDADNYPGPHMGAGLEGKVPDHVSVTRALDWIDSLPRDRPFQLYLNLQRTHFPYELPGGFEAPFQPAQPDPATFGFLGYPVADLAAARNRYDNALRYVDAQVGRLHDGLRQRERLGNTLWVITADHGESFHDQGLVTHGNSLRESQARVPLFLHWPGHLQAGLHEQPVSALDVMPTVLSLLGLPAHPAYQGRAFAGPFARRDERPAQYLTLQGLRYADAIVCWPYKVIHESNRARLFVHDLARDPGEVHDLMDPKEPKIRALAHTLLQMVQAQRAYHEDPERMRRQFAPPLPPCP